MALGRYRFRDAYTEAELIATFRDLLPHDRLKMLKRLAKKYQLPLGLIERAATDESGLIRAWVARTISDLGRCEEKERATKVYQALSKDPDEYVRAACLESEMLVWSGREAISIFKALGHMDRLALMRNPQVPDDVILAIFDREDRQLGLVETERFELIFAFLSNGEREPVRVGPKRRLKRHSTMNLRSEELGDEIWRRAAKWPEGWNPDGRTNEQAFVFQHVACTVAVRANAFRPLKQRRARAEILRGAKSEEECLQSALTDEDDDLRGYAFAKSSFGRYDNRREVVDQVLKGYDLAAMRGIAQNAWIGRRDREGILKRAQALGDTGPTKAPGFRMALDRLHAKDETESKVAEPTIREVTEGLSAVARKIGRLSRILLVAAVGVALWLWLR